VKLGNFKIVWDTEALNQFKEILEFLGEQSSQAPRIVKKAILDQIAQVKQNPRIFETDKLRSPEDKNFRAFITFSYRVTYQIKPDKGEIRILRIRHTSREPLGY
jgi:plasmid stabilization system protein ParE